MNRSEAKRKYKIDENYFDQINTEEKAYFLGFLYADGYNNTSRNCVRLVLQDTDRDIVQRLNNLLQPSKPLYFEVTNKKFLNRKNKYGLVIANKHISKVLSDLGCTRAKTFTITFPEWLDNSLYNHFIRGYFDGDGYIGYNKSTKHLSFELVGTAPFLSRIQDILESEVGINKTKLYSCQSSDSRILSLRIGTNSKVLKVKDWLYRSSTIYLDRKFDKFKTVN